MMRSAFWRAFALTMLVALASPVLILHNAQATLSETSHAAIGGSLLIPTTAEFDAFPYMALGHSVLVEGTTGVSTWPYDASGAGIGAHDGQVKLVTAMGDDWALQFQANNRAFGARLAEYAWHGTASFRPFMMPFSPPGPGALSTLNFFDYRGGQSNYDAYTNSRFDVDLVGRAGDGGWSVGLFNGAQALITKTPEPERNDNDAVIGARGSFGTGHGLNLSGEVSFESYNNEFAATTGTTVEKLDGNTFTVTGFGTWRLGEDEQDWTLFGAGHFASGSAKRNDDGRAAIEDENHSLFAFEAGAGKLLVNDPDGQVSAEVFLDIIAGKQDLPGDNAEASAAALALPGANVGFWHHLGGPFRIMGGALMNYRAKGYTEDDTNGDRVAEEGFAELMFRYTLGLGMDLADDKVALDVQVHPEGVPQILSFGNPDNLIMVASVQVDLP
jgi:hypothetical protein